MFAGTVITGGVVSAKVIVTVNDALPVLPRASVAVQVTVGERRWTVAPDAGVHVGVSDRSRRSVAVAVKVSTFPDGLDDESVMFAGTVTVGAVVSTTVILKVAVAWLPAASLAVHVTV